MLWLSSTGRLALIKAERRIVARMKFVLPLILVILLGATTTSEAMIELTVSGVSLTPSDSFVTIPVHLRNDADTIAGFAVWLTMSHPYIMVFDTVNPVVSYGNILADWEFLDYNLLGSGGAVIKVVGLYNVFPPVTETPLFPSPYEPVLFTLRAMVVDTLADTLCGFVGNVMITPGETGFSDLRGNLINWSGVDGHYDFDCPPCGDANSSGLVNIADVVYLLAYIFSGGPSPSPLLLGDVNCNGLVNIADVVYLVAYIFSSGPPPCVGC